MRTKSPARNSLELRRHYYGSVYNLWQDRFDRWLVGGPRESYDQALQVLDDAAPEKGA